MKTFPYRLPIILGIVLALFTWLILSLVPKQVALQKMGPELPNSAQPDTIIQINGEPLIKQPDIISVNADTTALENRQRINSAHVYVHRLDSLHLPLSLNELRITEHTNLTVANRELYTNRNKRPYWQFDSLIAAGARPNESQDTVNTHPIETKPIPPSPPPPKKYVYNGQLAFDWPSRMQVNLTYQIHLVITWDTTQNYLRSQVDSLVKSGVDTSGQHRKEEIKSVEIGKQMRARLVGSSSTDTSVIIMPIGDPERMIDFVNTKTEKWSWEVTPHRSGPIALTVYFERETPLPPVFVYSKSIDVQGVPTSTWDKFQTFLLNLNKLWASIANGAIGIIITAIWKYWQEHRQKRNTSANQ